MLLNTIHRLFTDVVLATQFVVAVVAASAALVLAVIAYDLAPTTLFGGMVVTWFAIYGLVALIAAVYSVFTNPGAMDD